MSLPELQSIVNRVLGSNADPASSSTTASVHAKLNQILTNTASPSGFVTNVQSGSVSMPIGTSSTTYTITAVDTSKSVVIYTGGTSSSSVGGEMTCGVTLTNSTTVTVNRNGSGSTAVTCYFMVITFANVFKSIQTCSVTMGPGSSGIYTVTATIASVNTSKAMVFFNGAYTGGSNDATEAMVGVQLTNATTVTFYRYYVASATTTELAVVVESN